MNNKFKVKIKSKDETLYYIVYKIRSRTEPSALRHNQDINITEFLIYDSKNGFNWINSIYCTPI